MKYPANLSLDLTKYRIRVHKSMLHQLGDPKYIQLLVNPVEMAVAIRCVKEPFHKEPIHKIAAEQLASDSSYEIYSRPFLLKLSELVPTMAMDKGLFHMSGNVFPSLAMAVFDLKTLRQISPQGGAAHGD